VGPQLRQLRRERHQTQAEMAKVLGISAGYVNLLENNERSLSLRLLMALADNYGVALARTRRAAKPLAVSDSREDRGRPPQREIAMSTIQRILIMALAALAPDRCH
jgi:transcriptional regulator with XRE-family HTH domain